MRGMFRLPFSSDFYPRPPRGGRPIVLASGDLLAIFLSTPSARRATRRLPASAPIIGFLSTPSARRATYVPANVVFQEKISIHALREEGDYRVACKTTANRNFYPRPPRGGRLLQ